MQTFTNTNSSYEWRVKAPEKFRSMAALEDLRAYLKLCPSYKQTPLIKASNLASDLNISRLSIKDETDRMGLGNFKALGGAFAIFDMVVTRAEQTRGARPLIEPGIVETLKPLCKDTVFCCASAGNHGLSVLAGANIFGARAVIYLAEAVPEDFAARLRDMGAEVRREGENYDASMAAARTTCAKNGWVLISDCAWEGYEDVPLAVMRGYSIISEEIIARCAATDRWPSHVFLQAGVGGLAGALANHIRLTWPEQPTIVIVEPDKAACLMESVQTGAMVQVDAPGTNMGRLDCAEASLLAFEILRETADFFAAVRDEQANEATKKLAQTEIATTPSGAAGYAGLAAIASNANLRSEFGIDEKSHCLCFASERALST